MLIIETTEEAMSIDVKRFYFPARVTVKCPKCGKEVVRDFSGDYLSYPVANAPMDVSFHHTEEEPYLHHEWKERLTLRISLEGVDDDTE